MFTLTSEEMSAIGAEPGRIVLFCEDDGGLAMIGAATFGSWAEPLTVVALAIGAMMGAMTSVGVHTRTGVNLTRCRSVDEVNRARFWHGPDAGMLSFSHTFRSVEDGGTWHTIPGGESLI